MALKNDRWGVSVRALAGVGAILGSTALVTANPYGSYNNENDYLWGRTGVPDFDQSRTMMIPILGLPNGGSMYCVPTSAMDNLAYIASHGYPEITPGLQDGLSPASYQVVTLALTQLGFEMDTSPTGGTSASGWLAGVTDALDWRFFAYQRLAAEFEPTTMDRAALYGTLGGLISVCYGRYDATGLVLTNRDGGHCMTLIRAESTGPNASEARFRDPATGTGGGTGQLSYGTSVVNCQTMTYINATGGFPSAFTGDLTDLPPSNENDDRLRIIDKIYVIYPMLGLTVTPSGAINAAVPNLVNPVNPSHQMFNPPTPATCVVPSPDATTFAYLNTNDELRVIDRLTGADTLVPASLNDPKSLEFGRDGLIYVLDGNDLVKFNLSMSVPEVARFALPIPAASTAHSLSIVDDPDAAEDRILFLITDGQPTPSASVGEVPTDFSRLTETPVNAGGVRYIADDLGCGVKSDGASLWAFADETLFHYEPDAAGGLDSVFIELAEDINDISILDDDRVLVATDSGIAGYEYDASTGQINGPIGELDVDWTNGETPKCFRVTRSRTNFDVDQHSAPGWNGNILTDELTFGRPLPECKPDVDGNGVVDINDLLNFLANWFTSSVEADYTLDGVIDINDLLAFLSDWFVGCP